ncbi:MAG: OprO/OprP family phosphate-selective porin [Planctomycetes bacterium]|nr:OprO/OprP family phosphate-selective porin [Planctomycetota bacterium]
MKLTSPVLATTSAFLLTSAVTAQSAEERIADLERQVQTLDQELESMQFGDSLFAPVTIGQAGLAPAASKVYSADQGLAIGGYGEMLYTNSDSKTQADLYRAIMYLGYRFNENWLFNSEIEWEHVNETYVEFAYLEYQHSDALNLRFGHLLTPMGIINQLHEPTTFLSPNRPSVERYILPTTWHENGVAAYGNLGAFEYNVTLMNGFDAEGFDLADDGMRGGRQKGSKAEAEDLATIVRLDWMGDNGMWLGGSLYLGDSGQGSDVGSFSTTVMELHAQYEVGGFIGRAVWASAEVDGAGDGAGATTDNENISGYYVDLGYDLFADGNTDASLTPYLRYSAYDLDEDNSSDSEVTRTMLGVAYQPMPSIIFKAAFTQEDAGNGDDDDIIELATGYVF